MPLTREMSKKATSESMDLVKGLKAALQDEAVMEALRSSLVQPLLQEIESLKALIQSKEERIQALEQTVKGLEFRCDDLEQYSRRNSLRIYGIPERLDEKLAETVTNVINKELLLEPPIKEMDICRVHRVGPKVASSTQQRPCSITLKLATYQIREKIYKKRTILKRSDAKLSSTRT